MPDHHDTCRGWRAGCVAGALPEPELAEVARHFGVFYARQPAATAGGGYVVDHTSDTYVVARDGRLDGRIPHAASPEDVAAAIRKRLNQP